MNLENVKPLKKVKVIGISMDQVKIYKCIKGFSIEKCDDDGLTLYGDYMVIEEGSKEML